MTAPTLIDWTFKIVSMADALSVPDGGFTVDPRSGEDVTSGYAVAVHPDLCVIHTGDVEAGDILAYMISYAADILARPGRVVGGWRDPDSGMAYLDVSTVVPDLDEAMSLAREHRQLAIFDLAQMISISVP